MALALTCGITMTDDHPTDQTLATMIDAAQVTVPAHKVATAVDQDMAPAHATMIDAVRVAVDPARKAETVAGQDTVPVPAMMIDVDQAAVDQARKVATVVDQEMVLARVMTIDVDQAVVDPARKVATVADQDVDPTLATVIAEEVVVGQDVPTPIETNDMNVTAMRGVNTTSVAPIETVTTIEMATVTAIVARNAPPREQPKNADFQRIVRLNGPFFIYVTLSTAKGLADHVVPDSNGDPSLRSG